MKIVYFIASPPSRVSSTAHRGAYPYDGRPARVSTGLIRETRLVESRLEARLLHPHLDTGALLLERHGDARVALAPAAVERFRHLGERQVRQAHRHALLAAKLGGEGDVLVRQAQGEVRRIVLAAEELVRRPVEGPLAAGRTHAHGLPERQRLDARLHAERENLRQRGLDGVAGAIVDELGDRARANWSDVHRLVADRVQHGLVPFEHGLVTADPEGELARAGPARPPAH